MPAADGDPSMPTAKSEFDANHWLRPKPSRETSYLLVARAQLKRYRAAKRQRAAKKWTAVAAVAAAASALLVLVLFTKA